MLPTARGALRRGARLHPSPPLVRSRGPRVRFASNEATPKTSGGASGAVTGGLVGGGVALGITYAWYHFSGARSAVQTARSAKSYVDSATESLKIKFEEKTPDTNEAIKMLRDTATKYAAFVPGGKAYVDSAFNDLDTIRSKHGGEVDKIVSEAYGELRDKSKKPFNLETASETYEVLSKHIQRLLALAKDAAEEILENHPQLKEKLGGSADQLKQLGERLGPEAKKQIDETWQEVSAIVQQGVQADSLVRAQRLLQDKTQQLQKMAKEAFDQGWEQVKPMLDKNPAVKQFVEQNMDALKQGNTSEVIEKVRNAVSTGSTEDLQKYVQQAKEKTQGFASGQLSEWLKSIPNGDQIVPQLQKLWEAAGKDESKEVVKGAVSDIKEVLEKRMSEIDQVSKK